MPPASSSSRCELIFAKQCILATLNNLIGTGPSSTNLNSSASTVLVDMLATETLHASAILSARHDASARSHKQCNDLACSVLGKGKDRRDPIHSRFLSHRSILDTQLYKVTKRKSSRAGDSERRLKSVASDRVIIGRPG